MSEADNDPAPPRSRGRRWTTARLALAALAAVLGVLRLVVGLTTTHSTTPQAAGYHSLGTYGGTTFWLHSSALGTLRLRTTGGPGGGCSYDGPEKESSPASQIFGSNDSVTAVLAVSSALMEMWHASSSG